MKQIVASVGASLFVACSVAACSGTTEPQLGFGPRSPITSVNFPQRTQVFGDIPLCNKSPSTTKIVVTGIALNEPTNGITVQGWGWKDTYRQRGQITEFSDENLDALGFVNKPVEVKMDCAAPSDTVLPPNASPEFAIQLRAPGQGDVYTKGGLVFSYLQDGKPMTSTQVATYIFCGGGTTHDPAIVAMCPK
jgi:hypothetical protein